MNTLDRGKLEQILAACKRAPCIASLGLDLLEAGDGFCRIAAPIDPRFAGLLPGFHGGMLAMVADCVAWFAIVTRIGPAEPIVTTDLDMRYLAPCLTGVMAEARVIKFGRTLCPVSLEMTDDGGRIVACGMVTYMRVSNLKPPDAPA